MTMITSQESLIEQIANLIFTTLFNLEVSRAEDDRTADNESLTVTVHIAGAWTGCVLVALSADVSRIAAANMLHLPNSDITSDDEREVALELVNMVGGNLKSLLPAPSFLSLPTIIAGAAPGILMHEAQLVDNVHLTCETGSIRIALYERLPPS